MTKKLLLPILAIYLMTHAVGCSSSDTKDDADVAAAEDSEDFADEAEGDYADYAEEGGEEEFTEEGGDEEFAEEGGEGDGEQIASDDSDLGEMEELADGSEGDGGFEGGDEFAEGDEFADNGEASAESSDELAMDEGEDGDEESEFPEEVAEESEPMSEINVAEETQPSDENLFTANNNATFETPSAAPTGSGSDIFDEAAAAAPPPVAFVPLQKVKDVPFERGGVLLNRVYIGRSGDTLKSVSEKIFGSDRSAEIRQWNSGVRENLWVGEKVYYSSPRDPQDSSRMLTYYEDMQIPPQIYNTREGDNIRSLGKDFLGHENGWKEIWSTNMDVASKGALPAGIELKYWPDSAVPAVPTAPVAIDVPAQPPVAEAVPHMEPQPDPNQPFGSDPMVAAGAEQPFGGNPPVDPAQPSMDGANFAANNPPPEVPPPPVVEDPVPPPEIPPPPQVNPPVAGSVNTPANEDGSKVQPASQEDETLMYLIGGIGVIVLVGGYVMIKKKNARQIDFSQTQV